MRVYIGPRLTTPKAIRRAAAIYMAFDFRGFAPHGGDWASIDVVAVNLNGSPVGGLGLHAVPPHAFPALV